LNSVWKRGETVCEFLPLVEVTAVDGIAVCNSFVLGAEADRKEAVVMADLDGEDFRFAMSDPVQWCEVREIRTLRRVQGESCVQRDVEIAKSFESNGCIWATGTTRRLPDVFCGVCRG